ncbi:MAG: DUF1998 domain-containing protein [Candidatus Xenobia bacterium]
MARLVYGHTATIWRINLGWSRRKIKSQYGFVLDIERGFWARNEAAVEAGDAVDDQDDPMSRKQQRVIPYVEDRRNCLLLEFGETLTDSDHASLLAALKLGIQFEYQIEDNEVAAEPLPSRDKRRSLLFFEAAEGGAGVLRCLVEEPEAFARVARRALEVCHFDPQTGEDRGHAHGASEDCEAACYDCLMSYGNQMDHKILDRQGIRDRLLQLTQATVEAQAGVPPRAERLRVLREQAQNQHEADWLDLLEQLGLELPSHAHIPLGSCDAAPDFLYRHCQAAIYLDGPGADRARRDADAVEEMCDMGYLVVRFGDKEDWDATIARNPNVFGKPKVVNMPATPVAGLALIDLNDFSPSWRPVIQALAEADLKIEAGGDVEADGRVVGQFVAQVGTNGQQVHVVDTKETPTVVDALSRRGARVILLSPEPATEAAQKIVQAVKEAQ